MNNIRVIYLKYKVLLLQKISQVLLGKLSGNVPSTVINSIEENLYNPIIRRHVKEIITIANPLIETYHFPAHFPSTFRRHKAFDKKNLYLLNNVCVSPYSGLTWIDRCFFLVESLGSLYRMIGWENMLHEPLLKWEQLHEEEYVISCPNHPFFHWIFESLPGILISLEAMPSAKIMVPKDCPSYCRELLMLILGEQDYNDRIIVANGMKLIPKYFTLQQEPDAGFVHPVAIEYLHQLRDKVVPRTTISLAPTKIYISRRKTPKRKLANEEEVEQVVHKLGFSIVYSEELSIEEQMIIFSHATCIVAPHGAGLSNMVWARQSINIIEIFTSAYFNDCFGRLAVSLGFKYDYINAVEHRGSGGMVMIDELRSKVQSILKEEPEKLLPVVGVK
ncbi:glycosyltransferase family 61 protein [Pontibacter cellulosilyticus]|uniref:Glycosyltransferase family 61 protein n=1 Tax=Pontibacter cellulosilyticus TaxID=1720253 RepID=A0A923SMT6_9BACT|nr:glycosyltransferase 61 family protein [Pontibacter cellulosilyticus]MBC5992500.1 glycosyltransferase family 61 protein [Pontibacter cellulosilyticus]